MADADVLIHVVDASGRSDREGVEGGVRCCTKGHVWGHGGVSVSMCGHLGWRIGDDY